MNKSIYDNDDTQNVIFEHEDGQAFPNYESEYTNENEWDSSELDEENMEPTHNDSDHGLGNASFDPHFESIPMDDEPTQTRPLEV